MNIYDVWPYFGSMILLLVVFSYSPVFKFIDAPPSGSPNAKRVSTLDGLRGFLAPSVFFHHAIINYTFLQTGGWGMPPSRFYGLLGQVPVALFFLISGFLFWEKLLREQNRINWPKLYIGRLFRIAPIYLVALGAMLVIVFIRSGFELHQPIMKVAGEIGHWLGLGLTGSPDVNGVPHTRLILAAVTGTLHYEWIYYFSLLLTYYLAIRKARLRLALILLGWTISLAFTYIRPGEAATSTALFLSGMLAATLLHDGFKPKLDSALAALAALACLTIVFLTFDEVKSGACVFLLAIFFFIVCAGNNLFGLLTSRAAERLGHISYSVYLMQGLALTLFYWSPMVRMLSLSSVPIWWLSVVLCGFVLAFASSVLYVVVERPGIMLGVKANAALAERRERRLAARNL